MHMRLERRMPVHSECLQQPLAFTSADINTTRPEQCLLQRKHSQVAAGEREEPHCKSAGCSSH
jgi:hypothetical protein